MNTRTAPLFLVVFTCLAATGCGIPRRLSDQEKSDYSSLVRAEVIVEKKSPGTAIGLGFAPFALGAIYSKQWWVHGTADFLFWPVSILWAPINSWSSVRSTNYDATVELIGPEKVRQIGDLDRQREAGQITEFQYHERARAIVGASTPKP
jgi:hypothetical protein